VGQKQSSIDVGQYRLDVDGLRLGIYADPPYVNIVKILRALSEQGYRFKGTPRVNYGAPIADTPNLDVGEAIVETHWIARRPFTLLAGIPKALTILKECTGFFDEKGVFVNTAQMLDVEAMEDGEIVEFDGDPKNSPAVLIIRGRFRDYALLKTPMLGVLARASRIATNSYLLFRAAKGKPVYFFSARFDPPEVQAADGYAYHVAVSRFNADYNAHLPDVVATRANTEWWGGGVGGTISHEAIACFLGDPAELMLRFCETMPLDVMRVALIDFHNDCIGDARHVMRELFVRYRSNIEAGRGDDAMRYKLRAVRVDTPRELLDKSLERDGRREDYGPSVRLVRLLRKGLDEAWREWELPADWQERGRQWCEDVRIMVSGGFTEDKIKLFESERAPVDQYGVGSAIVSSCLDHGSTTDFSSALMRIKVGNDWVDIPKAGRRINENARLKSISL
jgi:nicotinate phosphoribosyltransferase